MTYYSLDIAPDDITHNRSLVCHLLELVMLTATALWLVSAHPRAFSSFPAVSFSSQIEATTE
jgi:hypothetical protein